MGLVIFDPVAPHPYSLETLRRAPLGGTEATVIRVAEALDATVWQHNRHVNEGRYRSVSAVANPSVLVVLRDPKAALGMAARFPRARVLLWMHDLAGPGARSGRALLAHAAQLAAARITVVCVSDFHARQVGASLAAIPAPQRPDVVRIYNPVDVSSAAGEGGGVDPDKLVFFSSPHKGLDHALTAFACLRQAHPALRLYLANPGYYPGLAHAPPGVVNLGAVPHHVILQHVKTALCTFYPNFVFPETFGLVLGESNALGTPVLTHGIGATDEVLHGAGQIVPVPRGMDTAERVLHRLPALRPLGRVPFKLMGWARLYGNQLHSWREGKRPAVLGRAEFATERVAAQWRQLVEPD
jgi:glycosyltransferase involved in cell wall biosynthesis